MSRRAARAAALAVAVLGTACLMTIDESRVPCETCGSDAAVDVAKAETGVADAPVTVSGVRCGSKSCVAPNPVCCVVNLGENDYRNGACDTAQDCPTGDYFHCTRPAECSGGASCCIVLNGAAFTRTECSTTCSGASLCEPGGAPCPGGKSCTSSSLLPGLFECK